MAWTFVFAEVFDDPSWRRPAWVETIEFIEDFELNVPIKYGTGKLYGAGWKYGESDVSDWQPISWSESPLLDEDFEAMDW